MQVRRPSVLTPPRPVRAQRRRVAAALLGAVLVAGSVAYAVALRPLTVVSDSMSPTVCRGDRVVVNVWRPESNDVSRGDLVVFRDTENGGLLVKRVVGLPGDRVAIEDARLKVNGRQVHEPYVDHDPIDGHYHGPIEVDDGHVFVLGDNRAVSVDSRARGPVPASEIVGFVVWVVRTGEC